MGNEYECAINQGSVHSREVQERALSCPFRRVLSHEWWVRCRHPQAGNLDPHKFCPALELEDVVKGGKSNLRWVETVRYRCAQLEQALSS